VPLLCACLLSLVPSASTTEVVAVSCRLVSFYVYPTVYLACCSIGAHRWGKRAAHNRAQIIYYLAENLELRRSEFADRLHLMTGSSLEDALAEVDASIQRLFYWGAYCDKYGGTVQVSEY